MKLRQDKKRKKISSILTYTGHYMVLNRVKIIEHKQLKYLVQLKKRRLVQHISRVRVTAALILR